MRRLVLVLAAALALVLPAVGQGAERPVAERAVAADSAAHRAADGRRVFDVVIRGRASAVVVCELQPVVCTVAKRGVGRRWRAVVPRGPVSSGLPAAGIPGRAPEPAPVAGDAARFRIAVYAFQGPRFTLRRLGGRYQDA